MTGAQGRSSQCPQNTQWRTYLTHKYLRDFPEKAAMCKKNKTWLGKQVECGLWRTFQTGATACAKALWQMGAQCQWSSRVESMGWGAWRKLRPASKTEASGGRGKSGGFHCPAHTDNQVGTIFTWSFSLPSLSHTTELNHFSRPSAKEHK